MKQTSSAKVGTASASSFGAILAMQARHSCNTRYTHKRGSFQAYEDPVASIPRVFRMGPANGAGPKHDSFKEKVTQVLEQASIA